MSHLNVIAMHTTTLACACAGITQAYMLYMVGYITSPYVDVPLAKDMLHNARNHHLFTIQLFECFNLM